MTGPTLRAGFTLIEMSIVLVVIGLIVGGVLVGRDLISLAAVRAQISQIEQYQQAVNTFRGKYGYLPGDMVPTAAAQFGFATHGSRPGQGNGDGVLEGCAGCTPTYGNTGIAQSDGETAMFWVDLSTANLISGAFSAANCCVNNGSAAISGTAIASYLPRAALGLENYLLVMGGTGGTVGYMNFSGAGPNFFVVERVTLIVNGFNGGVNASPGLSVRQASAIDSKIDDGQPGAGNVMAVMLTTQAALVHSPSGDPPAYSAMSPNTWSCYDNNSTAGVAPVYSVRNYPNNVRCTLAFKFN